MGKYRLHHDAWELGTGVILFTSCASVQLGKTCFKINLTVMIFIFRRQ